MITKVATKSLKYFGNHIFLELFGNEVYYIVLYCIVCIVFYCIVLYTIAKRMLSAFTMLL